MPSSADSSLARAAARFAATHGITLAGGDGDVVAALGFALLEPARAADRRRWLHAVSYHARTSGALRPPMSQGRSNAAVRFLAEHRLDVGAVLSPRHAERVMLAWDGAARRAFRAPADPVWRMEWWIATRRRFRVTLSFAADGSATVGYIDCGRKCANAAPHSTSSDRTSEELAVGRRPRELDGNADATAPSGKDTDRVAQNVRESGSADLGHTPSETISEGKLQSGSVSAQAV